MSSQPQYAARNKPTALATNGRNSLGLRARLTPPPPPPPVPVPPPLSRCRCWKIACRLWYVSCAGVGGGREEGFVSRTLQHTITPTGARQENRRGCVAILHLACHFCQVHSEHGQQTPAICAAVSHRLPTSLKSWMGRTANALMVCLPLKFLSAPKART